LISLTPSWSTSLSISLGLVSPQLMSLPLFY
jgi:hypothetical protein